MSKRYGRNQKRKAREQVASFESLRSRISKDLTHHLQQGLQNVRR